MWYYPEKPETFAAVPSDQLPAMASAPAPAVNSAIQLHGILTACCQGHCTGCCEAIKFAGAAADLYTVLCSIGSRACRQDGYI